MKQTTIYSGFSMIMDSKATIYRNCIVLDEIF